LQLVGHQLRIKLTMHGHTNIKTAGALFHLATQQETKKAARGQGKENI